MKAYHNPRQDLDGCGIEDQGVWLSRREGLDEVIINKTG